MYRIREEDRIVPQAASLTGFTRAFAAEFRRLPISLVDVDGNDSHEAVAQALASETPEPGAADVAWRQGRRFHKVLERIGGALSASGRPALRDRGVYIILGGMGGLGLTFARFLAATSHARLALVGRSALDEKKQQHLRDLNALGGEAIYCPGDVTDPDQLARIRAEVLAKWGAVNGIIDSAFVLRDQGLLRMSEERFREAFAPKARGTAAALWTFRDDPLDWFALFSSAISFSGGPGQSNYAAGSTLQDALGLCWNAVGKWPVRVLNWGFWGETGAVASEQYRVRLAALGAASIGEQEGIAAFSRSLGETLPQRAVVKLTRKAAGEFVAPAKAAAEPEVVQVRSVISSLLKIPACDLEDERPFEEYGVDSLVSANILNALESRFGKLPETLLFEHNTIARLAAFLAGLRRETPAASPRALISIRETGSRRKSFWVHSVLGEMNWAMRLAHHLGAEWPVFGFQAGRQYDSLEEMAAAYLRDLRTVQPRGPYILGGFSFGGSVAFEMARQLEQCGETVSWLVLLDAYAPLSAATESLARMSWDGFVPQVIGNLLIRQWGGSALLTPGGLPGNDPEAQSRAAARHVRAVCNSPQSEDEIAAAIVNATGVAHLNAELLASYRPRPCGAVERAVLFRSGQGFVGPESRLALSPVAVDVSAPDYGWTQWLAAAPLIHEVDSDHFSLGLEPAIATVGRRLADLLDGNRSLVFEAVKRHVLRVLPDVPAEAITPQVRLKDLGANSLDRVEVATCAMEELNVNLPRTSLAGVENLQSLVDILTAALGERGNGACA